MNCDSCFKTKETNQGMFSILVLGKSRKYNMNYIKLKYFGLRKTRNACGNSSFEKIRTIPINLIQLHYFDDFINEFNLIDLEIR